eukprot:GFUD01113681.1.p1 GENE.GFUD01113681.1~~GFUD01113681.1.p1  ORF type:complete len:126 (-),score=38.81 GFUD01113681.1:34-411(-)
MMITKHKETCCPLSKPESILSSYPRQVRPHVCEDGWVSGQGTAPAPAGHPCESPGPHLVRLPDHQGTATVPLTRPPPILPPCTQLAVCYLAQLQGQGEGEREVQTAEAGAGGPRSDRKFDPLEHV